MIKQAVPSSGDSALALCRVEACDLPKRGRLGCAIFGRGGLRSRIPCTLILKQNSFIELLTYLHLDLFRILLLGFAAPLR